jgi:dihydropteroate synthase-like protein
VDPLTQETRQRERIAFVTGTLAEPALRSVLERVAPAAGFDFEVVVLNIQVAALMTSEWAARKLSLPESVDRAVFPGHLSGDLRPLSAAAKVPIELGPKDLREIPKHFGLESAAKEGYGDHDIEIIAEINHVPSLKREDVIGLARRHREDGADVIDLGCDPGGPFSGIGDLVKAVRDEGFRVSIDSLDRAEIIAGARAGAELVLSVNSSNIEVAGDLGAEVVVIPDEVSTLGGLEPSIEKLAAWGVRYRIDPVMEPIGFGFARSLARYVQVRERFPDAEIFMGIGNLTELTDADTAAVNVILLGFCQELGIRGVLTTEVIPWARTCVKELDIARRLVHFAVKNRRLPKHLEPRLHILRDEELLSFGPEALERLAKELKDSNFRIFSEEGKIHAISAGMHLEGEDPFELFEAMGVTDPSHAFYLGYELAKAVTALTLGKNYRQDEALRWGFLTSEERSHLGKKGRKNEG